jgi:1-aminocyclopropane-1-carboxylate deaminase/D-cysteine desulfhydrase-like pyridoxal-dependent ACC family enzyme
MISDAWKPSIQDITSYMCPNGGPKVSIMRLDEIHPIVSGNKWAKLKWHIDAAIKDNKDTLLTYGGPHSNHLIATAEAARQAGLKSIGILRSPKAKQIDTPTLRACTAAGMELRFSDWSDFDYRQQPSATSQTAEESTHTHIIPPGGADELGRKGVGDIARWIPEGTTTVCLPVGSGTTIAGLIAHLKGITVIGFSATRHTHEQSALIQQWLEGYPSLWLLFPDHQFRGFAKVSTELIDFIKDFHSSTAIPLDIVYNGKMIYYLKQLITQRVFASKSHILCIHTGGLQGNPPGLFPA